MDNSQKSKDDTFSYALKVWLTGVLVPAVFWGLMGIEFFFLASIYSAVFSIPSGLLFWAAVRLIKSRNWGVQTKTAVLCLAGIVLTGLAFALMGWAMGENPVKMFSVFGGGMGIQGGYAAAICLGVVFFYLPDRNPEILEKSTDTNIATPTDHLHDTND